MGSRSFDRWKVKKSPREKTRAALIIHLQMCTRPTCLSPVTPGHSEKSKMSESLYIFNKIGLSRRNNRWSTVWSYIFRLTTQAFGISFYDKEVFLPGLDLLDTVCHYYWVFQDRPLKYSSGGHQLGQIAVTHLLHKWWH